MDRTGDNAGKLVLLGKVTKPHGIRGEIKVYPYSGEPENFSQLHSVLLAADELAEPVVYRVKRARVQKNCALLQLEGCETRNDAEKLVQSLLYVREQDLPELAEGEYYLRELEGKQIVTVDGRVLGRVSGIFNNGAQELARITDGKHEYVIPLVPEFLISIGENEVRVSLPPGLLEINS
jgi:16S rRNA processing protein RimM